MADTGRTAAEVDPAERGRIVLKDRVAQRIATKAALDTVGVHQYSPAVGKLVGRDLPRIKVSIAGDRIRAEVDIAVAWPHPLREVAEQVHTNVSSALTDFADFRVDGVAVHIERIVLAEGARPERTLL